MAFIVGTVFSVRPPDARGIEIRGTATALPGAGSIDGGLGGDIIRIVPRRIVSWGNETRREADAIARLNELKAHAVDTIVDLTVAGLGYLEELIANGPYIGMDRFGVDVYLPFEDRVATVATMCERGHADHMVLSHDTWCYFDELTATVLPNTGYLHIHNDVRVLTYQRSAGSGSGSGSSVIELSNGGTGS